MGAWGNKQFALATIEETLRDEPSRMKFKSRKEGKEEEDKESKGVERGRG